MAQAKRPHKVNEPEESEWPRERLLRHGASALSSAELVAIILNTGSSGESVLSLSQRILNENGGLTGLMRMDHKDLARIRGIGPAKAAKLKSALEMGRRLTTILEDDKPRIATPEDIVRLYGIEMATLQQEQLRVVLLNTKHHVIGSNTISQGTVNSANVRMAEVFSAAVRDFAPGIILVHNHPSGDPDPSAADIRFTADAVTAGKLLDIDVLDHVIIGQGRHASLKRLGLGFSGKEDG